MLPKGEYSLLCCSFFLLRCGLPSRTMLYLKWLFYYTTRWAYINFKQMFLSFVELTHIPSNQNWSDYNELVLSCLLNPCTRMGSNNLINNYLQIIIYKQIFWQKEIFSLWSKVTEISQIHSILLFQNYVNQHNMHCYLKSLNLQMLNFMTW